MLKIIVIGDSKCGKTTLVRQFSGKDESGRRLVKARALGNTQLTLVGVH